MLTIPEKRPSTKAGGEAGSDAGADLESLNLVSLLVNQVASAFRRQLRAHLAEFGVTLNHWILLRVLWVADGLTQTELSLRAGMVAPTTLTTLRAMEEQGLVESRQRPDNRKNMYTFLTPKGRRLRRQLMPIVERINADATQDMSGREVAVLRRRLLGMLAQLKAGTSD